MLIPDEKGFYQCEHDDFKTRNIFAYMHHAGMDFDWMVKISKNHTFNMFSFLAELDLFVKEDRYDELWHAIQGVTLMFVNSCGEDFDEFLREIEVVTSSDDMLSQIEQFLGREGNKND
jgi:3-deoxy-D-arabino-heptulosonate 7-phosphate (DAHP) synthase class II